ncbi:MAG: D-alanyl-D-alanine carboxypeptidase [Podoviridae sp. ctKoA10]|nr:MAG: D-alanyl-D-alanine carboxypeptidase [Podoviridae sp. ctKoA10]
MPKFILGKRSTDNLVGVHPDLVRVVKRALELSEVDFTVIEGLRTKERQAELLKQGFTKTMNSRHIIGQAVDIVPLPVDWNNKARFGLVAVAMKKAADELGVKITWGGDFKTFVDLPHYQIEVKK